MKSNITYKLITSNDTKFHESLLEMASKIHKREKDSIEWLKWKYFNSPFGKCIVAVAIDEKNEIAGEMSFGILEFVLNGKIIKCANTYQTMVSPSYRGKGIFRKLTNFAIEECRKEGIEMLYTFPNKKSYIPTVKNGWKPVNNIIYWMRPVNYFKIVFNITSVKKPFVVDKIDKIDQLDYDKINQFFKKLSPLSIKNTFCPNRTYEFLKWRYLTFPHSKYDVISNEHIGVIVRHGNRGKLKEAQILEIFELEKGSLNQKKMAQLLKKIKASLKVDLITLNITTAHPINSKMRLLRFISVPHSIKFCVFPINEKLSNLIQGENWIITATEFHRY